MKNETLLTLSCLFTLLLASAPSSGEEFLLYTPRQATADQVPTSPEQGVLVRKVTVKRGDTLSHLSRKYIGVSSWFPQVLLFNSIKDPDLIYPGEKFLVPVRAGHATSTKKIVKGKRRHAARPSSHRHKPSAGHLKAEIPPATPPVTPPVTPSATPRATPRATLDEPGSYQRAKLAYLNGDYQKALALFDGFLRKFPDSKLAADASLYRADCFLHLSGE